MKQVVECVGMYVDLALATGSELALGYLSRPTQLELVAPPRSHQTDTGTTPSPAFAFQGQGHGQDRDKQTNKQSGAGVVPSFLPSCVRPSQLSTDKRAFCPPWQGMCGEERLQCGRAQRLLERCLAVATGVSDKRHVKRWRWNGYSFSSFCSYWSTLIHMMLVASDEEISILIVKLEALLLLWTVNRGNNLSAHETSNFSIREVEWVALKFYRTIFLHC